MIIKECIDFVVNILLVVCGICLIVILGSDESTELANGFLGPIEKYIFSDNNKQVTKETSSLCPLLPDLIWIEIKERLIYNA